MQVPATGACSPSPLPLRTAHAALMPACWGPCQESWACCRCAHGVHGVHWGGRVPRAPGLPDMGWASVWMGPATCAHGLADMAHGVGTSMDHAGIVIEGSIWLTGRQATHCHGHWACITPSMEWVLASAGHDHTGVRTGTVGIAQLVRHRAQPDLQSLDGDGGSLGPCDVV